MFSSLSSVKLVKCTYKQNYYQPPEFVRLKVWQQQIVPFSVLFCTLHSFVSIICLLSYKVSCLYFLGQMHCFSQPRVLWFYFYAYLSKILFLNSQPLQGLHHIICIWVNGTALQLNNLPSSEERDDLWGKPWGMKSRNTPNTKHTHI